MKFLPTEGERPPRLTQEQIAERLGMITLAMEVNPLLGPAEVAAAYRAGVPLIHLARWFRVPVVEMRDYVNVQIMGATELARIKRANAQPKTPKN